MYDYKRATFNGNIVYSRNTYLTDALHTVDIGNDTGEASLFGPSRAAEVLR